MADGGGCPVLPTRRATPSRIFDGGSSLSGFVSGGFGSERVRDGEEVSPLVYEQGNFMLEGSIHDDGVSRPGVHPAVGVAHLDRVQSAR